LSYRSPEKQVITLRPASERGVLFFNDQDITPSELKQLILRIGEVMGHPKEAGLHRSALSGQKDKHLGIPEQDDPNILIISSEVSGRSHCLSHHFVDTNYAFVPLRTCSPKRKR
jgi:alpha-ketoglutarate-dependent taurine dioxygenase